MISNTQVFMLGFVAVVSLARLSRTVELGVIAVN